MGWADPKDEEALAHLIKDVSRVCDLVIVDELGRGPLDVREHELAGGGARAALPGSRGDGAAEGVGPCSRAVLLVVPDPVRVAGDFAGPADPDAEEVVEGK